MSSIQADPDALRSTRTSFDSVAAAITGAAEKLAAVLAAEGECWGGDEIGAAFATTPPVSNPAKRRSKTSPPR